VNFIISELYFNVTDKKERKKERKLIDCLLLLCGYLEGKIYCWA
jgi:hypothetical protein